jgi:hypothetical protein
LLSYSTCGTTQRLAVVTTAGGSAGRRAPGVHVYNLDAMKLHASLPPPPRHAAWPPVAAMVGRCTLKPVETRVDTAPGFSCCKWNDELQTCEAENGLWLLTLCQVSILNNANTDESSRPVSK